MRKKYLTLTALSVGIAMIAAGLFAPSFASATDPCAATITKAGVPATSTEVAVTADGIDCVAKFKTVASDYVFTVPAGITTMDYLIVGGGGGGGSGGGGGGGVLQKSGYSVSPGATFSIRVGAGGAGGEGGLRRANAGALPGGSSELNGIVAFGGGGGGAPYSGSTTSQNGASGGGSRFDCDTVPCARWGELGNAGRGTPGQGNSGGTATYSSYGAGGGGGGAGGAGFNTVQEHIGGNGGVGISSSITGQSLFYGGGGGGGINDNTNSYVGRNVDGTIYRNASRSTTTGGGRGGQGGGGTGSSYGYAGSGQGTAQNATAGEANTGGGGGGVDPEDIGGQPGGSGVVIIRWTASNSLPTVTLDPNMTNVQPVTQVMTSGRPTELSMNTFARVGFIFTGWNTLADGTGTAYADEALFTATADTTLYAQWTPGVAHVVTFDSNTGVGTMATQTAGLSTALRANRFTKAGNTFAGWNTAADGTGFSYPERAIYAFQFDVTMYAQWTPIVTNATVTFLSNGADGGTTISQTTSGTKPLNLNGFTRTGYSFLGWNTSNTASTATYIDGQAFSFAQDTNLYAIWAVRAVRTLTFDGNGHTSGSTASQSLADTTQLRTNGFLRDGYTFLNWNTRADGTGTNYLSDYSYSFAASLTLYAKWGQNIAVTYNANGSDSGTAPAIQNDYQGSAGLALAQNTGGLQKTGYRLAGWNLLQDGTGSSFALGATEVKFTTNKILYAQWAPATYTVIYVANGAVAGTEPAPQTFTYGTRISIADNSGQLNKPGYTFNGWATQPDGTGTRFSAAAVNVSLSNDTILFAKWQAPQSTPAPAPQQPDPVSPAPSATPTPPTTASPSPTPSATPTPKATPEKFSISISGFTPGSAILTRAIEAKISAFLANKKARYRVTVIGFTEGPTVLSVDKALSAARAMNATAVVRKGLSKRAVSINTSTRQLIVKSDKNRRVEIVLSKIG